MKQPLALQKAEGRRQKAKGKSDLKGKISSQTGLAVSHLPDVGG
jgi:hypothetical protein